MSPLKELVGLLVEGKRTYTPLVVDVGHDCRAVCPNNDIPALQVW